MPKRVSPRYATIEKQVGETPLEALERLREKLGLSPDVPLAYAGRLDPMASGKLLILIGEECKKQTQYHSLDKEYEVEVVFGMSSDSGDVLGIITHNLQTVLTVPEVESSLDAMRGTITLPYPHFSSKTVKGKPLHTWTLEGRLNEIEVPQKASKIYTLKLSELAVMSKAEIVENALQKIESIPKVTDERKALGADFRRDKVRASWHAFAEDGEDMYQVASFTCVASSGTYMRSLAEELGKRLGTTGLALSIHRTKMGKYIPITSARGFWLKRF